MTPEQLRPAWTDVQNAHDLIEFTTENFSHNRESEYISVLTKSLDAHSGRAENPLYLQLLARNLLIGAEFQFAELTNQADRHRNHGWKRDMFSPVHILALGVSMAHWTLGALETKLAILDSWEGESQEFLTKNVPELLAAWSRPGYPFPDAEAFLGKPRKYLASRLWTKRLPVFIPDVEFLEQVRKIPLTGDLADRIKKNTFAQAILPEVLEVFFPSEDPQKVADMFLNDEDTWN